MTSVTGKPTSTDDGVSFLKSKTSILGQKLHFIILITVVVTSILLLLVLFLVYRHKSKRRRNNRVHVKHIPTTSSSPLTSINVDHTKSVNNNQTQLHDERVVAKTLLSMFELDSSSDYQNESREMIAVKVEMDSDETGLGSGSGTGSSEVASSSSVSVGESLNSSIGGGCGRWFNMKDIEIATNGFATENVIGEGVYGVVYRGVLQDGSSVAVKNLLDSRGQAEKEFKVEVEAIGKVRHKNLVGLIGFCAEGAKRLLLYELVDNGNLEQWLHGDLGSTSPLTWDIRMKIAVGTAKGLAYLHEGLEPKVVHRDVKSSNILLDKKWNAKVADFGLAKLLDSEKSYVTTRVMGTFGYVSPDYASTGMLNEGSDVYSFGVLLMEVVTGRSPVDYSRPPGEMNLVDWFKGMVESRRGEELLDPKIELRPSPRALKRALLVCLRCIDMDASKRPKMGQVVHMLEVDEFPFRGESRQHRDLSIPRPVAPAATEVPFPTAGDKQR